MITTDINIMSWNATGIMSSASYLCNSLRFKQIDICGISEHWLYEKDLIFLNQIDSNYKSHAVSDFDLKYPGRRRVGKGGVALLWHRKYDGSVTPLSFDDDKIIGIKLEISPSVYVFFFQIYLPCINHSFDSFKDYVDRLNNILGLYSEKGLVVIMGDMNANILSAKFRKDLNNRSRYVEKFLKENNLVSVNTLDICTGARSSFVSYDNTCESLIDHILFPLEKVHYVYSCEICNDDALNVSRHRPVFCRVRIPAQYEESPNICSENNLNWKKVDVDCANSYKENLLLNDTLNALAQSDLNSKTEIDKAYTDFVQEVKAVAKQHFPVKKYRHYLKPYWTDELSILHREMKRLRQIWIRNGRPRNTEHDSYKAYKAAKRNFRRKHRQCSENFMKSKIDEIDQLAEIDSQLFWRHVNSRRKKTLTCPGSDMIFDGKRVCGSREITDGWADYFKALYTPSEYSEFDSEFKDTVMNFTKEINNGFLDPASRNNTVSISPEEVCSAVSMAHKGKACGEDGIYYEHIIYGGEFLYEILSKFFTAIVLFSYVPVEMKKGVIITLFKGGNKRKDDPDNYRAITLSSVVLKLLERILLTRIQLFDNVTQPIHSLQGGFQKNLGCLMTSFLLRESIYFANENRSKLFVCFLDVKKAFDHVWHEGLFYKLYHSGINKSIYYLIVNMYTDMYSCVKCQGHRSHWFQVLQGTRQGGVLSPFLYLLFINDLLYQLESSGLGFCIYDINCCCPTVADDMLLASYSKTGLDKMMNICYGYSVKWRYLYNALKCLVIVFNESKNAFQQSSRIWMLGNEHVDEGTEYVHLGVRCDKYMSIDENIKSATNKIRGTFLSLSNCGIYEDGLNPLSIKRIYNSIVLPKALYGCELWSNILPKHVVSLERAHRFCVKFMQFLPRNVSTDIALSLLGMYPIEAEIDCRKLIFFGQLCLLPGYYRIKEVFLRRLVHCNGSLMSKNQGFLPDILRILDKYSISYVFGSYIESGSFMTKNAWKKFIRHTINNFYRNDLMSRLTPVNSYNRILKIHVDITFGPHVLWKLSKDCPRFKNMVQVAIRFLGMLFSGKWPRKCCNCDENILSETEHLLLYCPKTDSFRKVLWHRLFGRFGVQFYNKFKSLSPSDQVDGMFSGCFEFFTDETDRLDCLKFFITSLKMIRDNVKFNVTGLT